MAERDPVEVLTEQVKALGARNAELTVQTLELGTTMKRLQTSHAALEKERDRLQAELDAQSGTRPDVSFQALGEHLSLAVAAMEAQTPSGARFRAGSARFDIRVALGLDADGAPILRLPSLGEAIDPATLSTVTVDLVPSELDDVDFDSLVVVPKLTGGDAALAARLLADAGLAVGATVEIDSPRPGGNRGVPGPAARRLRRAGNPDRSPRRRCRCRRARSRRPWPRRRQDRLGTERVAARPRHAGGVGEARRHRRGSGAEAGPSSSPRFGCRCHGGSATDGRSAFAGGRPMSRKPRQSSTRRG